ncbi:hypothetical protein D3C71_1380650 [compost metagenome]
MRRADKTDVIFGYGIVPALEALREKQRPENQTVLGRIVLVEGKALIEEPHVVECV